MGLAVARLVDSENLVENATDRGQQLRQGLADLANRYPHIADGVRGWGLINGLVVKIAAGDVVKQALTAGLLLVPAGKHVVRLVPPLNITAAEIEIALERLEQAILACAAPTH